MISHSNNEVWAYFKNTKHKVAPLVYWFLFAQYGNDAASWQSDAGYRPTTLLEIADFLNTNRHSVSRALRLLREMGVVRYRRDKRGLMIDHVSASLMENKP